MLLTISKRRIPKHRDSHGRLRTFLGWIQRSSILKPLSLVVIDGIFYLLTLIGYIVFFIFWHQLISSHYLVRRILIFPKGNNVEHLSMYLDVADSANLPYGWSRYAQFSLAIVNQVQTKYSVRKGTLFASVLHLFWAQYANLLIH